jgi:hypothetical protein
MRNRSWRRAQRERVIAHTRRWMKDNGWFTDPFTRWSDPEGNEAIRKNAVTPHPCSNFCCGNPRKWNNELTRQEVLSRMKQQDDY